MAWAFRLYVDEFHLRPHCGANNHRTSTKNHEVPMSIDTKSMSLFERKLTLWVALCIVGGIGLGKIAPNLTRTLDSMSIMVNGAPVVSVPIAICLFFMMYPIMVKIDFGKMVKASENLKPVILTLVVNWGIKPFTMFGIATLFLGVFFKDLLPGTEMIKEGTEVELYRSYISGAILLGIAPCTAMVLVWSFLAKGNQGLTLIMVAVNSLLMIALYGLLGRWLLGVNQMPVPWQALLLSVSLYVALPLVGGYFSRKWILQAKGQEWFNEKFLHYLTPVSIAALLVTLVLLFSFKGETILQNPMTIFWIAIPLTLQTILIFAITYLAAKLLNFTYEDAAPSAMIGASNHFEVAIATAVILFGQSSGVVLATVVGLLIEVPLMLMLVSFCKKTAHWFPRS